MCSPTVRNSSPGSWLRSGSGHEGGEKLGTRPCCGSEDIDGPVQPVQKGTEYQERDERVALEESLCWFVRSAPRASNCSLTHHVTAIAARLQSGHASPPSAKTTTMVITAFCMPNSGRAMEEVVSSRKVGDGSHLDNQANPSIP